MSEKQMLNLHICVWPRNGVLAIDIHAGHHAEYMMGQMEYPNRTADPEEQVQKRARL